jgi:tRNA(Phe) wybutosine-synthesizing methylase Tyw3
LGSSENGVLPVCAQWSAIFSSFSQGFWLPQRHLQQQQQQQQQQQASQQHSESSIMAACVPAIVHVSCTHAMNASRCVYSNAAAHCFTLLAATMPMLVKRIPAGAGGQR